MKVIFSSYFDNGYYLKDDPPATVNRFNEHITGPLGLMNILERDLGLTGNYPDPMERKLAYQAMLDKYEADHPDILFGQSFRTDPGGVTAELLKYRDQLVLAGWNKEITGISDKVDTMGEIEKTGEIPPGPEDRWINILNKFKAGQYPGMENMELTLAEPMENMHPFFKKLIDILREKGWQIIPSTSEVHIEDSSNLSRLRQLASGKTSKTDLDISDQKSFQVIRFRNGTEIAEFVASQVSSLKNTVIINQENSVFDNMQNAFGLPVSGSSYPHAYPQVVQLLKLSASLFVQSLDIYNLLSYLLVDMHPLPAKLRYRLLKVISEQGGIKNEEWNDELAAYDWEEEPLKKQWLPYLALKAGAEEKVRLSHLLPYLNAMETWAVGRRMGLSEDEKNISRQLVHLQSACSALQTSLHQTGKKEVSGEELKQLMHDVDEALTIQHYQAQRGSIPVVETPGQLLSKPDHCIWMDFYNEEIRPAYYDFLNQDETKRLSVKGLWLWEAADQARARFGELKSGILAPTQRITLLVAEKKEDKPTQEHPLMSLLRAGVRNIEEFIEDGNKLNNNNAFQQYGWTAPVQQKIPVVPLPGKRDAIRITKGSFISNRTVESASSIETLIQYPFDWIFQYPALIKPGNTYQLDELFTTLGNVAHKFIETLLREAGFDLQRVRTLLENYHARIHQYITGYGAILLLPQNRFEKERFIYRMERAVTALLEVIETNNLVIIDVEHKQQHPVPLLNNLEIMGSIDLLLQNIKGNQVIFDLKWTRRDTRYRKKLEEGKHLQLAIYKALLAASSRKKVDEVGYFLLSDAKLITRYPFIGDAVVKIDSPIDEDIITKQISNAYAYRMEQLKKGLIEEAEEELPENLDYFKDQDVKEMVPLDLDSKNRKKRNYYSAFQAFKGNIN